MINNIIAYNIGELEKKTVTNEAKNLYKSGVIDLIQWDKIKEAFVSNIYTPSIFIRILLFIAAILGMLTSIGPLMLMAGLDNEMGLRTMAVILGIGILLFTELVIIKGQHHYRSGVTEAGVYASLILILTGLLLEHNSPFIILATCFLFALFAAIRYLDLLALVASVLLFGATIAYLVITMGGSVTLFLPIILLVAYILLYCATLAVEKRITSILFTDQFIILKSLSLLLCYLSVNYFVVREFSESLLYLDIPEGGDIPLAILFYGLTALLPIAYMVWGVIKRSILFIRVGLFIFTLTVFTFKIYFSVMPPVLSITIAGLALTAIALLLLNYLKTPKNGFTREMLLSDKWSNTNLHSFIVSQSLGGNSTTPSEDASLGGGKFGGAGAGQSW